MRITASALAWDGRLSAVLKAERLRPRAAAHCDGGGMVDKQARFKAPGPVLGFDCRRAPKKISIARRRVDREF